MMMRKLCAGRAGLIVVDPAQCATARWRPYRDCAARVAALHVELDDCTGRQPGHGCDIVPAAGGCHRCGLEGGYICRPVQDHGRNSIGIVGIRAHLNWFSGGRHGRTVRQLRNRGPQIGGVPGVALSRCSGKWRRSEKRRSRRTVEIKAGIELIGTCQPPCPKRDLVFASGADCSAGREGGFHMIVHVFGRSGSDQMQHVVVRIGGIGDNPAQTMIAQATPCICLGFEGACLNYLNSGAVGILDDADIVQQYFARIEQADNEFVPECWLIAARRGNCCGSIGVRSP